MVGQGVVRECLLDPEVTSVKTIGRTPTGIQNSKLRDIIHVDLFEYRSIENDLRDLDACFFCLGTPSAGKSEEEYKRVSYDITLNAARVLASLNPNMTFIYVSGIGADSSEKGPVMWARVRGKTENDLMKLPFKGVYILRPGIIRPMHGIQSKTALYRMFYSGLKPILPALQKLFPNTITSTENVGRKMLSLAKKGSDKKILTNSDFQN